MSLQQSSVLVDRALVTLCTELPESLGLYNTVKDQFSLSAMRSVPNLEKLVFESKKHLIIRDWMRSYMPKEDQPLTNEISMDTLKQTLKEEKRKNANIVRGMNEDMMPSSSAPSSKSSSAAHAQKKKDKRDKKDAAKRASKASGNGKAKAKASKSRDSSKPRKDRSSSGKGSAKRVRRHGDAGENESEYDSSSSSESSTSSSSDSEREEKSSKGAQDSSGKKKAKSTSNLPPVELVLSSDEDEPNDLFDTEDPDVYEVESILDKRKGRSFGEPDMYLIKWVGYEETTWEPADNVSKDLIEEFEGQPVRENEYIVEEIRDRKSTRDKETKLKTFKYLIKWVGYDDLTWEPAENLPHNLRRKFDQKFEARKRRKTK